MTPRFFMVTVVLLLTLACDKPAAGSGAICGLAAVAGPTVLLNEFSVPGQTLAKPPAQLPERLVARIAAGPSFPAIVGRVDSTWVIGLEGTPPPNTTPGFGVLVLDRSGTARGVMIYEGPPVEGAPQIGTVLVGATTVPLVSIEVDPTRFEDPRCPLFPDSVLQ